MLPICYNFYGFYFDTPSKKANSSIIFVLFLCWAAKPCVASPVPIFLFIVKNIGLRAEVHGYAGGHLRCIPAVMESMTNWRYFLSRSNSAMRLSFSSSKACTGYGMTESPKLMVPLLFCPFCIS